MEEMGSYKIYWMSKIKKAEPRTGNFLCSEVGVRNHEILLCIYIYIYIYIHTHTHTNTARAHTHTLMQTLTHNSFQWQSHRHHFVWSLSIQVTNNLKKSINFYGKSRIAHMLNQVPCHKDVQLCTLLTMAVCGGMWSVSCPKTLTVD